MSEGSICPPAAPDARAASAPLASAAAAGAPASLDVSPTTRSEVITDAGVALDITDEGVSSKENDDKVLKKRGTSKRPPFCNYGHANVKPVVGGFMYGDYMATHNASAGSSLPLTRRAGAADCGGAQVHFMEADVRRSAELQRRQAASEESRLEVTPRPASVSAAVKSKTRPGSCLKAQRAAGDKVEPSASAPAVTSCGVTSRVAEMGCSTAPSDAAIADPPAPAPMVAPDHYAALPPYTPAAYCSPPSMILPHHVMPAGPTFGNAPPFHATHAPAYVPFVPNAIGEALDPRRFKFAPRSVMATVMPAGKRSVRRDNLGEC